MNCNDWIHPQPMSQNGQILGQKGIAIAKKTNIKSTVQQFKQYDISIHIFKQNSPNNSSHCNIVF